MKRYEIDFVKYIVLGNTKLKNFCAVEKRHSDRIETLYKQYNGFIKIPDHEKVDCFQIVPSGNSLFVNENSSTETSINLFDYLYLPEIPASYGIINVTEAIELMKTL